MQEKIAHKVREQPLGSQGDARMFAKSLLLLAASAAFGLGTAPAMAAKTLKITLPRHTELTPVQRLNREGVDALIKHRYENAQGYFYKAYLFDPGDPFTLTNLGYVSELQGDVDKAERFYKLAEEQSCTATIDRSSVKELNGRPMMDALGTLKNNPMRVNRMNVLAMELLSQDRGFEAEAILKDALAVEPQNAFTLNNLGVDAESTGDLESALKYYDEAAATRSMQPVIVTLDKSWRGKPVSKMAAESAKNLRTRMKTMDLGQIRSAMLSIRGVSALNQNDWGKAKQDFQEAYSLNPVSAFTLNNLGYVAEHEGDYETAKAYYERARLADDAGARVGLATRQSAEGQPLTITAEENHSDMDVDLAAFREKQRGRTGTYRLKRRDGSIVKTDDAPKDLVPRAEAPEAQPAPTSAPAVTPTIPQ